MEDLRGRTALVTGASGGLGAHLARRLAREGMHVALTARREAELSALAAGARGARCALRGAARRPLRPGQVDPLIERAEAALGPLDLLLNNAGVEPAGAFTALTREELTGMVDLNLTAPLLLTHRVLRRDARPPPRPRGLHLLARRQVGPPYDEPYAATKAGLIGLTQSLRAEYRHEPVGFSVVCPGFIAGDGMYQRMVEAGLRSNRLMGETTLERVADAVVRAIRRDLPEVIERGAPSAPRSRSRSSPLAWPSASRRCSGSTSSFGGPPSRVGAGGDGTLLGPIYMRKMLLFRSRWPGVMRLFLGPIYMCGMEVWCPAPLCR